MRRAYQTAQAAGRETPVTLTDESTRSPRLTVEIAASAGAVLEALTEPVEIVRWIGCEVWGFVRAGGHLDIVLGPEDQCEEGASRMAVGLEVRDAPANSVAFAVAAPRTDRTLALAFTLEETNGRTRLSVSGSALDSSATDPFSRRLVRAARFHVANLKSVLEGGRDLRESTEGELFRFEGTALAGGMRIARAEVRVATPPEAAFRAFTDADALAAWWPGSIDLRAADGLPFEAIIDWAVTPRLHAIGTLARCDDPESLRLEWTEATAAGSLDAAGLVAFLAENGGSRVVVVERSDAPLATWAASLGGSIPGWDGILARFARYARGS